MDVNKFPFQINTTFYPTWPASQWCEDQFGSRWEATGNRKGTWCCFWKGPGSLHAYVWYFKHEQDVLMFSLKWL